MKKSVIVLLTLIAMFTLCACGGASSGKLVMATNAAFEPYEFIENGEITGIDADIAKAICDKLGVEYNRFNYNILRLETYYGDQASGFKPLSDAGEHF